MSSTLKIDWCSHEAAKYAVEHWHYSKSLPTPPVVKIGVWEDGKYIGCVLFSRGATDNLGTPYGLKNTQVCELTRIALSSHKTKVSRIVAIAVKMMCKANCGLRIIVSFADENQGHFGGIYQAGNWIYSGKTSASSKFRDSSGRMWHGRQVSSTGVKRQYGVLRRVPKIADCVRISELPKHRYLMPLDDEMRKQIEPLRKPYPKKTCAGSVVSDTPGNLPGEGGAEPTSALTDFEGA
jgi:hypothetical protein